MRFGASPCRSPASSRGASARRAKSSPDAATAYGELATLEARFQAVQKSGAKNASLAAELAAKRIAYAAMTNALVAVDAGRGEFSLRATVRGRVNEQLVASGVFAERGTDILKMTEAKPPVVFALVPFSDARGLADGAKARVGEHVGTMLVDRTRTDGLVGVWIACDENCDAHVKVGLRPRRARRGSVRGEAGRDWAFRSGVDGRRRPRRTR